MFLIYNSDFATGYGFVDRSSKAKRKFVLSIYQTVGSSLRLGPQKCSLLTAVQMIPYLNQLVILNQEYFFSFHANIYVKIKQFIQLSLGWIVVVVFEMVPHFYQLIVFLPGILETVNKTKAIIGIVDRQARDNASCIKDEKKAKNCAASRPGVGRTTIR